MAKPKWFVGSTPTGGYSAQKKLGINICSDEQTVTTIESLSQTRTSKKQNHSFQPKFWVGVCHLGLKTLILFQTKICNFQPYLRPNIEISDPIPVKNDTYFRLKYWKWYPVGQHLPMWFICRSTPPPPQERLLVSCHKHIIQYRFRLCFKLGNDISPGI